MQNRTTTAPILSQIYLNLTNQLISGLKKSLTDILLRIYSQRYERALPQTTSTLKNSPLIEQSKPTMTNLNKHFSISVNVLLYIIFYYESQVLIQQKSQQINNTFINTSNKMDLTEQLIAYESTRLDKELPINDSNQSHKIRDEQNYNGEEQNCCIEDEQSLTKGTYSSSAYSLQQLAPQGEEQGSFLTSSLGSSTMSHGQVLSDLDRSSEENQEESESFSRKVKKVYKTKEHKKNNYPTKNFLPNFKTPHIQYLERKLGYQFVNKFNIIKEIKAKNGISMKDYEALYRIKEFQKPFIRFFKDRVVYRELMVSRSSLAARKIHILKLKVFENAFNSKNFSRIN